MRLPVRLSHPSILHAYVEGLRRLYVNTRSIMLTDTARVHGSTTESSQFLTVSSDLQSFNVFKEKSLQGKQKTHIRWHSRAMIKLVKMTPFAPQNPTFPHFRNQLRDSFEQSLVHSMFPIFVFQTPLKRQGTKSR